MGWEEIVGTAGVLIGIALFVIYATFLVEVATAKRWGWFCVMFFFWPAAVAYAFLRTPRADS